MPKYLITYHGGSGMPEDPAEQQQMMQAFGAWVASVGTGMVDPGAPVAVARTVSEGGVAEGQSAAALGGYSIIEADSMDGAVKLVENHPFISRGGTLQVNESVVLPGA